MDPPLELRDGRLAELADLPDAELARQARAGSAVYFAELVRRHEGRLLHYLMRRTGNRQDAEDLLQETFLRAYRRLDAYDSRWKITTWLFTIASRLATSHGRRHRPVSLATVEPAGADEQDPAMILARREEKGALWTAAQKVLSESQYLALWFRYAEDMAIKDIARVMGKTRTHVKVMLYRARTALGRRLAAADAAPAGRPRRRPSGQMAAVAERGG